MDILVCSIDKQQIGLELNKINSVVLAVETKQFADNSSKKYFLGLINVHGLITVVLNMRELLGLPMRELEIRDQFIICNLHHKQAALWVDRAMYVKRYKEEEFVPANQVLPHIVGLQYVIKEENEQIILIYNLDELLPTGIL